MKRPVGITALGGGPAGAAAAGGAVSNGITTTLNEAFGNAGFNDRSPLKIVSSAACGAIFGGIGGAGASGTVNQANRLLSEAGDKAAAIVEALLGSIFGSGVSAPAPADIDLLYEI